jgi:alpha-beta hydrolase superfamily lysophospholipase
MAITHEEGALTQRAGSGPALYFTSATPEGTAKAIVGVLHGYADHVARYARVMDAWAERGIASVAIDLRGHGRAKGPRGYCARFDEFLEDAGELARLVEQRARGASQILFGHSFGGLVASLSAIESPRSWRALVLSNPYFGLGMPVPVATVLLGRVASRIVPKLSQPSGLKGADMTRDPKLAREYDEDPLVFRTATARWFTETTAAQARALELAPRLRIPLWVTFGTGDRTVKLSDARLFFDRAGSKDKTWDAREGYYHETLSDPEWRPVADAMADFMLVHA